MGLNVPLFDPGPVYPPEWDDDLYAVRESDRASRADDAGAAVSTGTVIGAIVFAVGLAGMVAWATIAMARWGIW